jgi:RHH-type rel operon transcriptional repressor/antitoxin RelB
MANRKPLIDEDGEVREITAKDADLFKPFATLPAAERKTLLKLGKRGPQKAPQKAPVSISLRLPDDLNYRLDKLSKLTGRSKTFYMVEAISEKLADLEDLYLAEQRTLALRAGRSKTYTLDEVEKRLGLVEVRRRG